MDLLLVVGCYFYVYYYSLFYGSLVLPILLVSLSLSFYILLIHLSVCCICLLSSPSFFTLLSCACTVSVTSLTSRICAVYFLFYKQLTFAC